MSKSKSKTLFKNKSAWIPVAMSAAALLEVIIYLAVNGFYVPPQQGDEYLPAHIFQLLLAGQIPFIAYFLYKHLFDKPRQALKVLVVQFVSALIPFLLVSLMEM